MAGRIPSTFIDSLIARADIVEVINRRVPLTAKGREYMACCPFHDEKTPSFSVSPSKQFYHCFGCGAHGTAIGFLMNYENLSFVEAVEELAETLGLEVPREGGRTPREPPGESPEELLDRLKEASEWFQQQLHRHEDAPEARRYLESRGLDGSTCTDFGIGFAPEGWDGLLRTFGTDRVRRRQLLDAGLIIRKDGGTGKDRQYDRFRGRIIFPIEDHRGRTVAFGGRVMGDGEPKYLNSPETSVFHKGRELYGLHRARRAIGQAGWSLVVEGYMDVVSLNQFGLGNVVGTLGTATTQIHLQRLFRLAPEIVFCFDGDRAGREAAWRALRVALPEMRDGRQLSFLFLPEGEDPDTYVRDRGVEEFRRRVKEDCLALDRFLFDTLKAQVDMNRLDGKASLVNLARPLIQTMPQSALREMMLTRLSELSGLSGEQLMRMEPGPESRPKTGQTRLVRGRLSPLATAISLLLQYPEAARGVEQLDVVMTFQQRGTDHLKRIVKCIHEKEDINTARLLEEFRDSEDHEYIGQLAVHDNQVSGDMAPEVLNDILIRLQKDLEEEQIRNLTSKKDRTGQVLTREEERELRMLLEKQKVRLVFD